MDISPKSDDGGAERTTRRIRTLDEKLAILKEAAEPGASIAAVARKHGMNANLLFGWRRLHRRGLLEGQRHAPAVPLLPVKITTPTVTPTQTGSPRVVRRRAPRSAPPSTTAESFVELVLPDGVHVRLYGDAQRVVLERLFESIGRR